MIWFTSDTHFGHENVLKFTDRPWETIQQMNSVIVANINARVGMNDELYILGDFSFKMTAQDAYGLRKKITCKKVHLVPGNHDKDWAQPAVSMSLAICSSFLASCPISAATAAESPPSGVLASVWQVSGICLARRMARSTAAPCATPHPAESFTSSSYASSSIRKVFFTLAKVLAPVWQVYGKVYGTYSTTLVFPFPVPNRKRVPD